MSDRVTDQTGSLIRRLAQTLNRKVSEIASLLINHKHAGSFGALAGFAIAVIFTWKFMRSPQARPSRNRPKPRVPGPETEGLRSQDLNLKGLDVVESPVELNLGQIMRRKLSGGRKIGKGKLDLTGQALQLYYQWMTIQLLGVILEESTPQELQKQATIRPSVLEVLLEISKTCDIYLMERVLDDESEERVLSALDGAGLFLSGSLTKDKVLFCSTDTGRMSFVRQLEPDWHVDSNLEIVSQLARFIRCQLHISELELGQIASNVFTSKSLEQYFACL